MLWGLTHRIDKNKYFFEFKTSSQFSFMENNAMNSDDNILDEGKSFTNNSFNRISSIEVKYHINQLALFSISLTEHTIEDKQLFVDNNIGYSHQNYLLSPGIEFKNNNLSILTSLILNLKDIDKEKLSEIQKLTEEELLKPDISDQEKVPTGLEFSSDGKTMFVVGKNGDEINIYSLATAWNISTAEHK